jgi:DNA-binding NarL/FixJ family response regulator
VINNQLVIPATVLIAMAVWAWALHMRQQRRVDALEGRVANLLAGVALLTDTAECGLRDVTAEVARLNGSTARPRSRTTTQRRIAGAVKRGQSVQAIAAAEQISEGEVKLRLSMSGAQEGSYAEVC